MWNQLKRWLHERGAQPRSRRISPTHFRGQFENLEARSMLSASYADAATPQIEMHIVAIFVTREPQPTIAAVHSESGVALYDDAPWENLSRPRPNGSWLGPIGLHGGELSAQFNTYHATKTPTTSLGAQGDVIVRFAVDGGLATNVGGAKGALPNGAYGGNAPADDVAPGGNTTTNQTGFFLDNGKSRPPLPPALAGTIASYYSSLTRNETAPSAPLTSLDRSIRVQEAVFGAYSTDSLLLATDSDAADEEVDHKLEGKLDAEEDDVAKTADARHSIFDEATDAALNTLERERHAIDAVLNDLHDVDLSSDDDSQHPTQTHDPTNSSAQRSQRDWNSEFDPAVVSQNAYEADGGMVLLEPAGDANSNAYDLTAAYLPGLNGDSDTPLAVEASVGIYQAIDVGASELRSSGRDNLPIAQPASTVQPSVSAENAPSKKSEQPS